MASFPFTREERIQLENERLEAEERLHTMQQDFQWRFERCQKEMMEQFRQYEAAFARQIEELRSFIKSSLKYGARRDSLDSDFILPSHRRVRPMPRLKPSRPVV